METVSDEESKPIRMSKLTTHALSPNMRSLKSSPTLVMSELSRNMAESGQEIFRLGFGQSPFPVAEEVVQALIKHVREKDYLPVKGLWALREAVAAFNQRTLGIDCKAEQVMVGPGSKELIFTLQYAFYGALILPSPSWVSYAPQAQISGKSVSWVDTYSNNHWRLMPEALEQVCQKKAEIPKLLILNYPNNPTGCTYPPGELQALAKVARKYQLLILADEIYGETHHEGEHVSLASYYPEGTIISSGLSKWCGAGGWRLGTFTFPKNYLWLQNAMASMASETYSAVNAPLQYAAIKAFEGSPAITSYVKASQQILQMIGKYVYQKLSEAGVQIAPPSGGFYLFPDFGQARPRLEAEALFGSRDMCKALLLDTGVALLPGADFGRPPQELTARLSYVDFDGAQALKAVLEAKTSPTDADFLQTYSPKIIQACDRIIGWMNR